MTDQAPSVDDRCSICGGPLIDKKLKRFCVRCGQLCETCCDGGTCITASYTAGGFPQD